MPWMTVRSIMIKFSRIIYVKFALAKRTETPFITCTRQISTRDNEAIESKK